MLFYECYVTECIEVKNRQSANSYDEKTDTSKLTYIYLLELYKTALSNDYCKMIK